MADVNRTHMQITPEQSGLTIVLVGKFNPPIFRPEWFRTRELVAPADADQAKIGIIHSEIASFALPWAAVHVERERFVITTTEDPFVRIHDLLMKLFIDNLRHTPVMQLGINRTAHFRLADKATIDKIGFALAPPAAWGDWSKDIISGGDKHGGMRSLTMEQSVVADRRAGYIRATVQPSAVIAPGIWIEVNDHYELEDKSTIPDGSAQILEILEDRFDESVSRSEWLMDQVLRLR